MKKFNSVEGFNKILNVPKRKQEVSIEIPFTPDITLMDQFVVTNIEPITGDEKGRGNCNSIVRITLNRF